MEKIPEKRKEKYLVLGQEKQKKFIKL